MVDRILFQKMPSCAAIVLMLLPVSLMALSQHSQDKRDELVYGTVLFELYRRDYFNALVNDAWARQNSNPNATGEEGTLLQGGMQLSYGLADSAERIFKQTLTDAESDGVKNGAWYYLAKLHHAKSDMESARKALSQVQGQIKKELHVEYHYLSSLLGTDENDVAENQKTLSQLKEGLPEYPYIVFNFAIQALQNEDLAAAKRWLKDAQTFKHLGPEYENLADRSKHALAILESQDGNLLEAWTHLSSIRTTGLYSNRALLSYAWTAIKLERFNEAIPALKILDSRSIALPEVQEAKVLLAHLYEQDQLQRKALKQNIVAEKEFKRGLLMLDEAERIIAMKDVPKEFISNLDLVVRETDWYGERPEVDYRQLTPFLIDLLAAHNFNETLRELSDLYALQENIEYWLLQQEQHLLILEEGKRKNLDSQAEHFITHNDELVTELNILDTELRLMLLSFEQEDQDRFKTQLDSIQQELDRVDERLKYVKSIEEAYRPPTYLSPMVKQKHDELLVQLEICNELIERLERIVRAQVGHELERHRSRMTYYAAQARLAKARLYDATLQDLNSAKSRAKPKSDQLNTGE